MNLISREELKEKLDRGDDFTLVMTMGEWAFDAAHIPGSLNVSSPEQMHDLVRADDEIVVYCSSEACTASQIAYRALKAHDFANVRRYAGGIADWQAAGFPVESTT